MAAVTQSLRRLAGSTIVTDCSRQQTGLQPDSTQAVFLPALFHTPARISTDIAAISDDSFHLAWTRPTAVCTATAQPRLSQTGISWRVLVLVSEDGHDRKYNTAWFTAGEWQQVDGWCKHHDLDIMPAYVNWTKWFAEQTFGAGLTKVALPIVVGAAKTTAVVAGKATVTAVATAGAATAAAAASPVVVVGVTTAGVVYGTTRYYQSKA